MEIVVTVFGQQQTFRIIFWSLMAVVAGLTAVSFLSTETRSKSRLPEWIFSPGLFYVMACLWILYGRTPGIFYPVGFNVDEDQFLAAARSLMTDPVFFSGVDTGSSGPMNIYPLWLPSLLGITPSLITARLTGLLLLCGGLGVLFFGCRKWWPESACRLGLLIVVVFFASTTFWDFVHYASEMPSVAYLAAAWGLIFFLLGDIKEDKEGGRNGLLIREIFLVAGAAILLAFVPWAKLQGTVLALASGGLLLGAVFWRARNIWEAFLLSATAVLAACSVTAFFLGLFWIHGVLEYFWMSYIQNALSYREADADYWSKGDLLWTILFSDGGTNRPRDFLVFLGSVVACGITLLFLGVSPRNGKLDPAPLGTALWSIWGGVILLIGLAFWTVLAPSRPFSHYLLFLVVPMALGFAASLGLLQTKRYYSVILWILLVACLLPMAAWRIVEPNPYPRRVKRWLESSPNELASRVLVAAEGGNGFLTVWGYSPDLHTRTGLLPATRLATSSALFDENAARNFFRSTYLEDFRQRLPSVFVDAVAPSQGVQMVDRTRHGYELVPEIARLVDEHYSFFDEVDGVRIYRRSSEVDTAPLP